MRLEGIMPALFTMYDEDGNVTTDGLEDYLRFLIDRGCTGFFVGGSTGEGFLQTLDERKLFLEAVVKTVAGQLPVIAHVGTLATRDACDLARFAARVGADAVGSVMPIYYAIGTQGAVDYYRAIGEAAGLPLLIYYYSGAAVGRFDPQVFVDNFLDLPHLFAMKYTGPDLEVLGKVMDLTDGRLNTVMGLDQLLMPALSLGLDGAIGSTYNFAPEIFVAIYDHYRAGETAEAQRLMARGARLIYRLMRNYSLMAASREVLTMRGVPVGSPRAPLPSLTPQLRAGLEKDLEAIDFFAAPTR